VIAAWIDEACTEFDRAAAARRSEIALVREYCTRLTADVVTGKLDVREAAARLPDEPDDAEPVDVDDALAEDADASADAEPDAPFEALDA
jgi:type I restriction enzyme S subunit